MVAPKNIYITAFLVISGILFMELLNSAKPKHPDAGLNIEQLIRKYGYPVESHQVITDDHYILTLHRIPHGQKPSEANRTPILLMHGTGQTATAFINLGPKKALSFLLAEKDYDIWLGNVRGTTWSKKHKHLNSNKDTEFWNFSVHEMGVYDLPAFIDYILETTGQDKLHYVGYSQGAAIYFLLLSEKPQYANKVKLMSALAPAIFLNGTKATKTFVINFISSFRSSIRNILNIFEIHEIFSNKGLISMYFKHICNENSLFVELCLYHIFNLHGYNPEHTNKTMLSLVFTNEPAGLSINQLMHGIQLMESNYFSKYDFGTDGNLQRYGRKEPPTYDLSKVSTPVALYYSNNDWLVNVKNMERLSKTLPNVVKTYTVPMKTFNHYDFLNSDKAVSLLYNSVIEEILKN